MGLDCSCTSTESRKNRKYKPKMREMVRMVEAADSAEHPAHIRACSGSAFGSLARIKTARTRRGHNGVALEWIRGLQIAAD